MEALQLTHLESAVKAKLLETGEIPSGPQSHYTDIPERYKTDVREIVWELAYQGIIVPGAGSRDASLPSFQVTEWGKKCLEGGEYLPFEAGQYLERLQQRKRRRQEHSPLYQRGAGILPCWSLPVFCGDDRRSLGADAVAAARCRSRGAIRSNETNF